MKKTNHIIQTKANADLLTKDLSAKEGSTGITGYGSVKTIVCPTITNTALEVDGHDLFVMESLDVTDLKLLLLSCIAFWVCISPLLRHNS